ncbi:lipoate protein ligase C-terminal domain-containing protein [Gracilinema caldarium]|uniref:lipoate protein ligase C-terminal domain-containing protein n=1 Tax=Gracilinema caldarium TaxID=215591 RepID=UPI0026EC3DC1|nr:lipoate protein ligase C-terminal domain-containing protein [Gracilinema caldarium]
MTIKGLGKPAECKLIRFSAELEGSRIERIQIRGDFFAVPEEAFEELEERLTGTEVQNLGSRFTELVKELHIEVEGISGSGLAEVVLTALAQAGGVGVKEETHGSSI